MVVVDMDVSPAAGSAHISLHFKWWTTNDEVCKNKSVSHFLQEFASIVTVEPCLFTFFIVSLMTLCPHGKN